MKTKATNYITLEFPNRSVNEAFARTTVACFAAQMDPTLNELEDIKTAVSEAVTNTIVHSGSETATLRAEIKDALLFVEVEDYEYHSFLYPYSNMEYRTYN